MCEHSGLTVFDLPELPPAASGIVEALAVLPHAMGLLLPARRDHQLRVHSISGAHFGAVAGPGFPTSSAAVVASLHGIADDLSASGLGAADVRKVADLAADHREVLDEIREPRLLAGDLWTVHQATRLSELRLSDLRTCPMGWSGGPL
ncbi:hypothetical protein [Streptomyces sp. RB17]|uniref:hypothetical protein n=1 Tax=Streptomyces sp. RB17 TaxID=2585197 RepID=UPI00188655E1|nr:hypothetical protein [Streptomyces sp. RB17]